MKKLFFLLLALAGLLAAADRFVTIYIQDRPFMAEIADTPEKHSRGLMFRRSIRDNFGMLFVFADDEYRSFWMKNTRISLDIIYLNRGQQIVDMYLSVPPCCGDPCPAYVSKFPARYVLEIKGGLAKKMNLKIGDKIFLPIDY
ncbi:MAG: DUF192 domain-containing protein [Candidatus Aminicenantes bacterium]|nr:DUF192 domain-containing protein [Candidatus Aminicenantes bacterium]